MSKFRSSVLGLTLTSALVLSAASVNAADIYRGGGASLKDAPEYIPVQTWTGFYIGGNLGGAFDPELRVGNTTFTSDDSTLIGGVHAGFNFQGASPFVFGIEGDVNFADDINYLASVRGRIGFATPNALFYATGGVAFIEIDAPRGFRDIEETGYVVGGGVEFKPSFVSSVLGSNFSAGVEGLYYNFDIDDSRLPRDVELDFFTVRARVSYHFNKSYEPLK